MTARDLPESMIDIAEILGVGVALGLMQAFGGEDLKFPRRPEPDHPILKALGEEAGRALCSHMKGGSLYVPHGRKPKSSRAAVLALEEKGLDRRAIARSLGLSQRHVRRAANGPAPDRNQPGLFDD